MRLWHESLIGSLPRQQLLGQHRECCALRGNGWGKPHSTVNYVFEYPAYKLYQYHVLIMAEMTQRGYKHDVQWDEPSYRGKICQPYPMLEPLKVDTPLYPEHDADYLSECLSNLAAKGVVLHR